MMIPVEGHVSLFRDEETGAIINMNNTDYEQYLTSLQTRNERKKEIEKMKDDITEIKLLLKEILNETRRS